MKILSVVGARPNFMKIAPLIREIRQHRDMQSCLVHTGQHYDVKMAGAFFEDLQIPVPDVCLEVGSGSHAVQTAEVMKRLEPVLEKERPDMVLVVGDVNSTMAAALTAVKLHIPVAHVEAGLRSFDRAMPEEINRVVTDGISELLFVTEESGVRNLESEGVGKDKIFFVGNVMIDSLEASRKLWTNSDVLDRLQLKKGHYGVVTLHRPSNVDNAVILSGLVAALAEVARAFPIIFPIHPRTRKVLESMEDCKAMVAFDAGVPGRNGVLCLDPIGYLDFMCLVANAKLVLTDSGGIQEETTVLGIPCLTLRDNTERPVTVTHGTNRVIGSSPDRVISEAIKVVESARRAPAAPPLWDGHASERIVAIIRERIKRFAS
jgi:UDP-N-acetylglucosamine 2-epimerase (non-hydrolysing)